VPAGHDHILAENSLFLFVIGLKAMNEQTARRWAVNQDAASAKLAPLVRVP
jgi:hypothetical protein